MRNCVGSISGIYERSVAILFSAEFVLYWMSGILDIAVFGVVYQPGGSFLSRTWAGDCRGWMRVLHRKSSNDIATEMGLITRHSTAKESVHLGFTTFPVSTTIYVESAELQSRSFSGSIAEVSAELVVLRVPRYGWQRPSVCEKPWRLAVNIYEPCFST